MVGGSLKQALVNTFLPIGATITSIYVLILVFIFDKYQELEEKAAPRAKIYFISGAILLPSFLISGLSTVWLFGLRLGVISSTPQVPVYTLGLSVVLLIVGNTGLGALVIFTDIRTWWTRFDEWLKRWVRHSLWFNTLPELLSGNLFISLGLIVLIFGVLSLLIGDQEAAIPAFFTAVTGLGICLYGAYQCPRTMSGFAMFVVVSSLVMISLVVWVASDWVTIWVIAVVYLSAFIGALLEQ